MSSNKRDVKEAQKRGNKANCYECKYRGDLAGNAHSCCEYPGNETGMISQYSYNRARLNVKADPYGIENGWFMWPIDFDPVWLKNCDGFTPRSHS